MAVECPLPTTGVALLGFAVPNTDDRREQFSAVQCTTPTTGVAGFGCTVPHTDDRCVAFFGCARYSTEYRPQGCQCLAIPYQIPTTGGALFSRTVPNTDGRGGTCSPVQYPIPRTKAALLGYMYSTQYRPQEWNLFAILFYDR